MSIEVISRRSGSFVQRVQVASFDELLVDVPAVVGGDESAPDPHDYFDLSLGACKSITVQMYARRKGLPLAGIITTVDRDDSDERRGSNSEYRLTVSMQFLAEEGHELDAETRARLIEISERCPIHRLMTSTRVSVTSREAPASE
ncbi:MULTISPECIES: OsmC family protein [unclassified Cobetia]|uniref:OsmC family protein n=1 Tax=unclassified Cobetia TaxID=2609414 RepID=UPI0006CA276B|nr:MULTISPECIES: OsmC family protein [unclassified Cobetia]MBR9754374.1 OsmC family protein [Gammaproteobacteria bacterium]UTV86941.1 OsmC family protein [Cobetia litoralis]KPM75961.1 peroxiredoxin [Cobetia sp. UCD-24C]MCK8067147.1 OsmC family protein [Cobetia sp. 1CM21F]QWN35660.1 OsmC family protein [Cobetia sp. 4B]